MADIIPSPNMNLPVPVVSVAPGPEWASSVNGCLAILDAHDHTAGNGVPITPNGINLTTDLPFQQNNATLLRSVRFSPQTSPISLPTDLGCLYESGVDLYYNDGNGNQVRLTQSGNVAGTNGSIAGLVSPASATYVGLSETFVWQADANKPADMDFASAIFRNNTVSSFGLTLSPPAAMGADFSLVLPSLPVSQKIMTLDSAGNMAAPYVVDNSSIEIVSNTLQVKALGISNAMLQANSITTAKILDANVTRAKLASVGQQISSSSGLFTTSSASLVDVTNLSITITTTGRPVMLLLQPTASNLPKPELSVIWSGGGGRVQMAVFRDATQISIFQNVRETDSVPNSALLQNITFPGVFLDAPAAGTYVYKVQALVDAGTLAVTEMKLVGYEL